MTYPELLKAARAQEAAYLDTLEGIVRLESPTRDKAACDRLASHLHELLAGWVTERLPQTEAGDQLLARKNAPGETSTLLLCHYDTVWPVGTLEQMPLRLDGGRLYGPGILDMKAGVAIALHALRLAGQEGLALRGPVTLLLSSDEETGSLHSKGLIERLAKEHDRVLVLEPGRDDGALKTGRKGVGIYRVRFEGKSAHAGNNPSGGASALRELAHFLLFAEELTDEEAGTSVNLTVGGGGSTGNVISEEAEGTLDVRVLSLAEAERVDKALHIYESRDPRVKVTVTGGLNRPPMEPNAANGALAAQARSLGAKMGLTFEEAVVGGGSDGNFTSALGVPTLDGLGGVGEGPHARHEHIRIPETLERLALLAALLVRA